jgi:cell division septal protein FtsQ
MSAAYQGDRFFRPADVTATRRNRRQLQVRRALLISGNLVFLMMLAAGAFWLWQRTQSDRRFAIQRVAIEGAHYTSTGSLAPITTALQGANLFRLDIETVRARFLELPWIETVAIEKQLPDVLVVRVHERSPVAITVERNVPRYVDRRGSSFANVTPAVGNPDLPIVRAESDDGRRRAISFLSELKVADAGLYSRVSEIEPVAPDSFAIFDRQLRSTIYVEPRSAADRWKMLYQIARAENLKHGEIEYADLRFDDRVVVKSAKLDASATNQQQFAAGVAN